MEQEAEDVLRLQDFQIDADRLELLEEPFQRVRGIGRRRSGRCIGRRGHRTRHHRVSRRAITQIHLVLNDEENVIAAVNGLEAIDQAKNDVEGIDELAGIFSLLGKLKQRQIQEGQRPVSGGHGKLRDAGHVLLQQLDQGLDRRDELVEFIQRRADLLAQEVTQVDADIREFDLQIKGGHGDGTVGCDLNHPRRDEIGLHAGQVRIDGGGKSQIDIDTKIRRRLEGVTERLRGDVRKVNTVLVVHIVSVDQIERQDAADFRAGLAGWREDVSRRQLEPEQVHGQRGRDRRSRVVIHHQFGSDVQPNFLVRVLVDQKVEALITIHADAEIDVVAPAELHAPLAFGLDRQTFQSGVEIHEHFVSAVQREHDLEVLRVERSLNIEEID